jgi:antitoxin component of MazEF toxin-antitoxin module
MVVKSDTSLPVARLRRKNQLTLPESVAKELGVAEGDRFRVSVEDGVIRLTLLPRTYYGALKDVWPDNWMDELRAERDAWSERETW